MTITERNVKIHKELSDQNENNEALNEWASDAIRNRIPEEKDPLLPSEQSYKPFLDS